MGRYFILIGLGAWMGLGVLAQTPPRLIGELGCANCHSGLPGNPLVAERSPDLSKPRLKPDELYAYLLNPQPVQANLGKTRMPDYHFTEKESLALTLFLSGETGGTLQKAKAQFPEIEAETGRKIFINQNCLACHKKDGLAPPEQKTAPDLSFEGSRVHREWLTSFLRNPQPIRPYGYIPGTGNRMPDFRLSDDETKQLADWIMTLKHPGMEALKIYPERTLSASSQKKAHTLLANRYSCLGCHALGNQGGRIGPDLSSVNKRLQPEFIRTMVEHPRMILPDVAMPTIEMPKKTKDLIIAYLAGQAVPAVEKEAPDLASMPFVVGNTSVYQKHCASCHGANGDGQGFNAPYLQVKPAAHNSPEMAKRSDDTLFDGIHAGGYIQNKSHQMPPWGKTLTHEEIRSLVETIRAFCQCKGPAWSHDP